MTYSDWREELSEKYKIIKGLYKIFTTPGVIKASPKNLLKNKLGTKTFDAFKKNLPVKPPVKYSQPSLSTPDHKPFKKGTDANPYSINARTISRRLNYKTKDGQTFKRNPKTETGDILGDAQKRTTENTKRINKTQKEAERINNEYRNKQKLGEPTTEYTADMFPKKYHQYLDFVGNKKTPKSNTPKPKNKPKNTKPDSYIDPKTGKKIDIPPEYTLEQAMAAPTNNVGDGKIAGTVEAGDNPPVKKKKRYIYGGRGSRKMWMSNK